MSRIQLGKDSLRPFLKIQRSQDVIVRKLKIFGKSLLHLVPAVISLYVIFVYSAYGGSNPFESLRPNELRGPLSPCESNPRYFTDGSGMPIYLTGSHTWQNLVDVDTVDPPKGFHYQDYLDFLQNHHHNFIRMWAWSAPRMIHGNDIGVM